MRTVIYVHQPSTVMLRSKGATDATVHLYRYPQSASQVTLGTHQFEPGIYMIVSKGELEVSGGQMDVMILRDANGKDIPPDPKAEVVALEPGATTKSIQAFLAIAKDITVGD